ncbi:MAG: hypothetical protein IKG40_02495 [Bacilli bacterium]|nr:hypothetical protein [Bacilli bacterium]
MKYNFKINNRAFNAICTNKKRVEIRATKSGKDHFDYGKIKVNDFIEFVAINGNKAVCLVEKINHYNSIEELLTIEGTTYTLSSTNDFYQGIKSINNIDGYKEAIKSNGVYAIHIKYKSNNFINSISR